MPRLNNEQIEMQIKAKLTRQSLLTQATPLTFRAVMDEAVLRRVVGGPQVMGKQLDRLIEVARLPNVTLQIIPFAVGSHPGLESNFNILELPKPTPSIVFVEGLVGSMYLERAEDLKRYQEVFERLQTVALSPKDTIDTIAKIWTQSGA